MDYNQIQERIRQDIQRRYAAIAELFASKKEKFEDEDARKLETSSQTPPPGFPFMIVSLAGAKDLLDFPLDLSLIFAIVAFFLSVLLGIALAFWCFGKISGGWWKKSLIRWLWFRFFIMLGIELIPFVNLVPANTIFVLMAHYKEKKIVLLFNDALEILHSGGGGKGNISVRGAFGEGVRRRRQEREEDVPRAAGDSNASRRASMYSVRRRQLGRGAGPQPGAESRTRGPGPA